jgi:hypothetical protein
MVKKTTTNRKDTTSKHVKNTQTGVEPKAKFSIRWYHIAATVVVLILVTIALVRIVSHFDPSLISSKYTVRYATGCTTSIAGRPIHSSGSYRYTGASNGLMFGKNGPILSESEAYLKILELGEESIKIQTRSYSTMEWEEEQEIDYGKEYSVATELAPDCMPGISYIINK